jgi:hypothetical protein
MAKIFESRPPVLGQQHTYTITPGPDPGCRVTFLINRQPVNIRDEVGGLKVVGFGAAGSMTVEVTGNVAGTTVEGQIDCPERPGIHAGPIVVGSGSYDNCEQEPCKTLRQNYINAAILAIDQERLVKPLCRVYRFFLRLLWLLLVFLLLVTILALVCAANPVFPVLCVALNAIMMLLAAAVLALSIYVGLLRRALLQQEVACDLLLVSMKIAYLKMVVDCPRECWIPEVKVECSCK